MLDVDHCSRGKQRGWREGSTVTPPSLSISPDSPDPWVVPVNGAFSLDLFLSEIFSFPQRRDYSGRPGRLFESSFLHLLV